MNPKTSKGNNKAFSKDSLIEQLRDVGSGVNRALTHDVVGGIAQDALSSLFGTPQKKDIQPGEEIRLPERKKTDATEVPPWFKPRERVPRPFHVAEDLAAIRRQEALVAQKIEEIRQELKALIATLKEVDSEVEKAIAEELVDPGIYHLSFLERLKTTLKLIRKSLSESASWLAVMRSRKKQRTYWALYKKKGTEFGLNHERVVATQVG